MCYVVQVNMKRFALALVVAWALPWGICEAEDGSIKNTKEYPSSEEQALPQHEVNATRHPQATRREYRRHWHIAANWRVAYYAHAHAVPWWPTAPGD